MTCPSELTRTLYLDEELPFAERADYERHLARCADCAESVRLLETIEDWIADSPPMPAELPDRVLRARHRRSVNWVAIGIAAAALLVLSWGARPDRDSGTGHEGPDLRTRIGLALARADAEWLDSLDRPPLVPLHRIALGSEPELARAALERLGGFARRESLPVLLDAVEIADRRGEAMDALAALGDPRAIEPIAEFLLDEEWADHALTALMVIGGPETARVLADVIDGMPESAAARPLVAALARLDDDEAARELLAILDRRQGVLDELAANLALHLDRLLSMAAGKDRDDALRAIAVLGDLKRPEAIGPLGRRLLDDRDLRAAAARALAKIGTTEAGRTLLAVPRSEETDGAFDGGGPGLETACLEHLDAKRPGERVRGVALLARCGGPRAVRPLLALMDDRSLAPHIVATLGRIECEEASSALARLARIRRHRREAVAAMGRAGSVDALLTLALDEPDARGLILDALGRISTAQAVAAVLAIDSGPRQHRDAVRALKHMEREVVIDSLTAMIDGDGGTGARGALLAIGAAPPGHRRIGLD